MRAFFAMVSREINERKALLAAAAVASLLPVLAPLLPSTGSNPAADIREAVMWVMVGALVPLFALLLGVSFIGRDLAEGRMGFYFSQPLSGSTIWFGKLTAMIVLVLSAEVAMMLPTALLSPDPFHFLAPKDLLGPFDPLLFVVLPLWVGPVLIVLFSHAMGILWRGRSAWLLVDLAGLILVLGATWGAIRPFLPMNAPDAAVATVLWMTAWTLIGLMVAGAVQLTVGRVDIRRAHRALSLTLWSILLVVGATALAWSCWVCSATPADLTWVQHVSVGSGDWIAVTGTSPGRMDFHPRFLFNASDGRWVTIDPGIRWYGPILEFSADGSLVAWPVMVTQDEWTLKVAGLTTAHPQPRTIGVSARGRGWEDLALSPSGSRIVVVDGRTVAAYDTDNGDQIAAAQIDGEFYPQTATFFGEGEVQILTSTSSRSNKPLRWRRYTLKLNSKRLSGGEDLSHPWRWWQARQGGESGYYLDRLDVEDDDRLVVVDAATLDVAADLGPMPNWSRVCETDDGLVAVARDTEGDHHIDVFSRSGDFVDRIDLHDADQLLFGGEVDPGRFVIGLWKWGQGDLPAIENLSTSIVDLNRAQVSVTLDGFAPVLGPWGNQSSAGAWAVGSTAGRLLQGGDGSLHLLDPETGEHTRLIPISD